MQATRRYGTAKFDREAELFALYPMFHLFRGTGLGRLGKDNLKGMWAAESLFSFCRGTDMKSWMKATPKHLCDLLIYWNGKAKRATEGVSLLHFTTSEGPISLFWVYYSFVKKTGGMG